MASPFAAAAALASERVDAVTGEAFDYQPMSETRNGVPLPDGSRAALTGLAIPFDDGGAPQSFGGAELVGGITTAPQIFPRSILFEMPPRRPDRFIRCSDGHRFEVRAVSPAGPDRLVITLFKV